MITPPPCASIGCTAAWQHRKAPVRLTRSACSQAGSGKSSNAPDPEGLASLCRVLGVELGVQSGAVDQDIQAAKGLQGGRQPCPGPTRDRPHRSVRQWLNGRRRSSPAPGLRRRCDQDLRLPPARQPGPGCGRTGRQAIRAAGDDCDPASQVKQIERGTLILGF